MFYPVWLLYNTDVFLLNYSAISGNIALKYAFLLRRLLLVCYFLVQMLGSVMHHWLRRRLPLDKLKTNLIFELAMPIQKPFKSNLYYTRDIRRSV